MFHKQTIAPSGRVARAPLMSQTPSAVTQVIGSCGESRTGKSARTGASPTAQDQTSRADLQSLVIHGDVEFSSATPWTVTCLSAATANLYLGPPCFRRHETPSPPASPHLAMITRTIGASMIGCRSGAVSCLCADRKWRPTISFSVGSKRGSWDPARSKPPAPLGLS